jgi:hypothetical protein
MFILPSWPFLHGFEFFGVGRYSLRWHNMPEVPYFLQQYLALNGLLGTVRIPSACWAGALGTCGQSRSRRPNTKDTNRRWVCVGVSIHFSKVAGDLQRPKSLTLNCHNSWPVGKPVFPCRLGVYLLANNRSSHREWRTIWLQPAYSARRQSEAVEKSFFVISRLVFCSRGRSGDPNSSSWAELEGKTRSCLIPR